ncbi:MAG TPA: hypothetical protein VNL15_05425 [Dehalococcoidia bacterium]|nr:hypothetical protein [Dehalococcoidia bacterium]
MEENKPPDGRMTILWLFLAVLYFWPATDQSPTRTPLPQVQSRHRPAPPPAGYPGSAGALQERNSQFTGFPAGPQAGPPPPVYIGAPSGGIDYSAGGQPSNATTSRVGGFDYTSGSTGGQAFNATTYHIGSFDYTSGSAGGQSFSATTSHIGSFDYTSGSMGGQPFNATTSHIGSFDYTSGSTGSGF